jgi:uncharacterized protein (TIGR03382 family)
MPDNRAARDQAHELALLVALAAGTGLVAPMVLNGLYSGWAQVILAMVSALLLGAAAYVANRGEDMPMIQRPGSAMVLMAATCMYAVLILILPIMLAVLRTAAGSSFSTHDMLGGLAFLAPFLVLIGAGSLLRRRSSEP